MPVNSQISYSCPPQYNQMNQRDSSSIITVQDSGGTNYSLISDNANTFQRVEMNPNIQSSEGLCENPNSSMIQIVDISNTTGNDSMVYQRNDQSTQSLYPCTDSSVSYETSYASFENSGTDRQYNAFQQQQIGFEAQYPPHDPIQSHNFNSQVCYPC